MPIINERTAAIRRQASFDKQRNQEEAKVRGAAPKSHDEDRFEGARSALTAATGGGGDGGRSSPCSAGGSGSLKRIESAKKTYVELEAAGKVRQASIKRSASLDRERNLSLGEKASPQASPPLKQQQQQRGKSDSNEPELAGDNDGSEPVPFDFYGDDSRGFEPVSTLPAPYATQAATAPRRSAQENDSLDRADLIEADAVAGAKGSPGSAQTSTAAALRAKMAALESSSEPSMFRRLDPSSISFERLAVPDLSSLAGGLAGPGSLYSSFGDLTLNPFSQGTRAAAASSTGELFELLDACGDGKLTKSEVLK
jgi:hypothetical protein